MKRRVWVAALTLSLGGVLTSAEGQQAVWRKVARPIDASKVRASAESAAGASLGKPVPITRGTSGEPRLFPAAYRSSPMPRHGGFNGVEPIATVPPPGAIIAASAPGGGTAQTPPLTAAEFQETGPVGELFAVDRVVTTAMVPVTAPSALPQHLPPQKLGNWQGTFSVAPPEDPAPEPEAELLLTEDLPPTKWYVRGEGLLWWAKDDRTPPLVTTAPVGTPASVAGSLDQPSTTILAGGRIDRDPYWGGRFIAGYYLDDCGEKAVELVGFFLGPRDNGFRSNSFQNAILARPIRLANPEAPPPNGETVELVSFPNMVCGEVRVSAPSQLWGLEPNFLCKWCCDCNYRIDLLAGFRYLDLRESLTVEENLIFDSALAPDTLNLAGATSYIKDRFAVRNQFYGGQVGCEARWQEERFTLDARVKVGLGMTQQQLDVEGFQVLTRQNAAPVTATGGLLALDSNIGSFQRNRFSVVPEVGITAGYYLTDRFRALVGYNFLYWSSVVRPGDQIDRTVDGSRIPNFATPGTFTPVNPPRPAQLFQATDFWAQGLTFGCEYRY